MLRIILVLACAIFYSRGSAQDSSFITIPASTKYSRSESHQKKWGSQYRKVWEAPVTFQQVKIDTLRGGLVPYQEGGGRQSKTLRLRDKNGREYVLRSIDKTFGKALPEISRGTFIERIIDDQASIGHPYAAVVIAPMAEAAGIFHTEPEIFYVPRQPALKEFNDSYGDMLYLFEERPDENWEVAPHLGRSKNIVGTDRLFEKLGKSTRNQVDQKLFVRSRLFDMFIGDWGRHEDQWRWAEREVGKVTWYLPIPRDRDQAFTLFDGKLLRPVLSVAGLSHLKSFSGDIDDVNEYNFAPRFLDRRFTSSLTKEDWITIARDLQQRLTDNVIRSALQLMPDTAYALTGDQIAHHLFSRRNNLEKFATEYYEVLSKELDIPLSEKDEVIEITAAPGKTLVEISNESGTFFRREFIASETKEIRLYGIGGQDRFITHGNSEIPVKLVGGDGRDSFQVGRGVIVYDNRNNTFENSGAKLRLKNDTAVHTYDYDWYKADKFSILPFVFYSFEDRFHVGINMKKTKFGWRKEPYKSMHRLTPRYSISQTAPSVTYENHFPMLFGKWGVETFANYDLELWTNFYGLGNHSKFQKEDRDFTRMRTREITFMTGLTRVINNRHKFFLMPYFRSTDLIRDTSRYIAHSMNIDAPGFYDSRQYAGGMARYIYQNINDSVLPEKGFTAEVLAAASMGIIETNNDFNRYAGELNGYIPLVSDFGIHIRSGAATLTGDPLFFQLNRVGGTDNLRGYERDRFHGRTIQYNQFNLRWIKDVRSYYYNGKFGVIGFADAGRAWIDDESSNKWHIGYGVGLLISPFNKITATVAYGFSEDGTNLHFDLIRPLGN